MLRTLLTRRWLTGLALACVFAAVTVWLGQWQWGRHEDALARRATVERHYDQPPVPVLEILGGAAGFGPQQDWTRVVARGGYDPSRTLLVRNRPHEGTYGYDVLVPFDVEGATLLVDRGWVRNAVDAATAPEVPPAPTEEVTVTGWLRSGEPSLGRDLPPGQLASIHLPEAATALGGPVLPAYLVLESEVLPSGEVPVRPLPAEPPDTGLGAHLAYALQWWLSSVLGFVMVWVFARREHLEGAGVVRAKRARIWDEEDA